MNLFKFATLTRVVIFHKSISETQTFEYEWFLTYLGDK